MLYKAKQLHLLIMRGLAQDGHRDYDGKTAQQHLSMAVAPAWGQGFSNGAFRKHLRYHANSLPWGGESCPAVCRPACGCCLFAVFVSYNHSS